MAKDRVLKDHIREGKVFKPPISQIASISSSSWVDTTMPELLWIAFIIDKHDLELGVDLSVSLARSAKFQYLGEDMLWFANISAYEVLSEDQQEQVLDDLNESGKLQQLYESLEPLLYFYPDCPLSFLLSDAEPSVNDEEESLEYIKSVLAPLYNKRDRKPILVQVQGVYIAFATDMLKVRPGSELTKLEEVRKYPETDLSLKVGASACASCNMFIRNSLDTHDSGWANYFWQRGFELDKCNYQLPYEV